MYSEMVKPGSRWLSSLKRAFTIPREINPSIVQDELEPYTMFRNITFAYHNESVQIRVEKDEFQQDMFLLVFCNKIIGYFEPVNA